MRCAPAVSLNGVLTGLPGGQHAPYHTMRVMRRLVDAAKIDVRLIGAVTSILFTTPQKDELAEVEALFHFVRDNIRYQRDVNGVEVVADPITTLKRMVGDCDDQAALLAAMLETAGYPTRFVIAGYNDPRVFEHIYLQVFAAGYWINLDPTEFGEVGSAPPNPVAFDLEA